MNLEAEAACNLGRWYTVWTEVGDTGTDPFDAATPLALCADLVVTATLRSPEWGDYWTAALASARRRQLGPFAVQALADASAAGTLARLPASIASQEAPVPLWRWLSYWGQAAVAGRTRYPGSDGRALAARLAPAVASSALSAARLDRQWAEVWAETLATGLGVPPLLEEMADSVITRLAPRGAGDGRSDWGLGHP